MDFRTETLKTIIHPCGCGTLERQNMISQEDSVSLTVYTVPQLVRKGNRGRSHQTGLTKYGSFIKYKIIACSYWILVKDNKLAKS